MNLYPRLYSVLLFFLFINNVGLGQNAFCAYKNYNPENQFDVENTQKGGIFKPTKTSNNEFFNVLFVFVQFASDSSIVYSDWEYGELPQYSNRLIDSNSAIQFDDLSLSQYWSQMSLGTYKFVGDVYPEVVTLNEIVPFSIANKQVIQKIDSNVDFSKYDNWTTTSNYNHNFSPDGLVDEIFIIYRNPSDLLLFTESLKFDGIAQLNRNLFEETITNEGKKLNFRSGVTITTGAGYDDQLGIYNLLIHEFGHHILGAHLSEYHNSPHESNGSFGIMSAWSYGRLVALSALEREALGYIDYITVNQDNFNYNLPDFVTTGQSLKVPIPITNPSSSSFYIVENHLRKSPFDQIARGSILQGKFDTNTTFGKGIYIFLVTNGSSKGFKTHIRMLCADGSFNWEFSHYENNIFGWELFPVLKRNSSNRSSLYTDRFPLIPVNVPGFTNWGVWFDSELLSKNYILSRDQLGDGFDALQWEGKRVISKWSNPSTNSDYSFEIFGMETSFGTPIRVLTSAASSEKLPPSEPQMVKIAIDIDFYPIISWEKNIEPDLREYRVYRSFDGINFSKIATVPNNVTFFKDIQIFTNGVGTRKMFYRVTAVDYSQKESMPSNIDYVHYNPNTLKISAKSSPDLPISLHVSQNYPNPFNSESIISITSPTTGNSLISVYNLLGLKIQSEPYQIKEGLNNYKLSLKNYSSGKYLVIINFDEFLYTLTVTYLK